MLRRRSVFQELLHRARLWLMGESSDTAHTVLLVGDHVLLLQDHTGVWQLPGGHRQLLEPARAAAQRELKEETSLVLNADELSAFFEREEIIGGLLSTHRHFYGIHLPAKLRVKLSEEHQAYDWFGRDNLPANTVEMHAQSVRTALMNSSMKTYEFTHHCRVRSLV